MSCIKEEAHTPSRVYHNTDPVRLMLPVYVNVTSVITITRTNFVTWTRVVTPHRLFLLLLKNEIISLRENSQNNVALILTQSDNKMLIK